MTILGGGAAVVLAVAYGCGSDGNDVFGEGEAGVSSGAPGSSGAGGSSGASGGTSSGSIGPGGPNDGGAKAVATPVDVVFTTDNAYKFGWGSVDHLDQVQGRPFSSGAGDIFDCPVGVGPEAYTVPADAAPLDAYLYVVAWDDQNTTQGSLGQFKREGTTNVLYTGDAAWEVCATGKPYDARSADAPGPDLGTINAEIARCVAGTGDKTTTSAGWVNAQGPVTAGAVGKLRVGEDNSANDGDFPITCQPTDAGDGGTLGIDPQAKWMWYAADDQDAFRGNETNRTRAFLIFRLPARALPQPQVN